MVIFQIKVSIPLIIDRGESELVLQAYIDC